MTITRERRIGYALCDEAKGYENLSYVLKKLGEAPVLELQPEKFLWDLEEAKSELASAGFISVHAPSKDLDLSASQERIKCISIIETIKGMDMAHAIGAHALPLHPVNNMHLDPTERLQRKQLFLKVFSEHLVPYYIRNKHTYTFCIETIEYPKYPATLEETLTLKEEASLYHSRVGMVIDIPHVWNSRRILREDPPKYRDRTHGYPGDRERLSDYIQHFIQRSEDDITFYHVAGFGGDPVTTHGSLADNMNREYPVLMPQLEGKPLVMEIHDTSFYVFKQSRNALMELKATTDGG